MACCKKKRLKQLVEVAVADRLFESELKTSVFKCIVEIVRNSKKRKFEDCFSKKTHKKIEKNQKFLSKLINGKISIKKRKKKFIKASKSIQKLFYSHVLRDFMQNCVEHE